MGETYILISLIYQIFTQRRIINSEEHSYVDCLLLIIETVRDKESIQILVILSDVFKYMTNRVLSLWCYSTPSQLTHPQYFPSTVAPLGAVNK